MALNVQTLFPPIGPAPYSIDRDWCIGDSLGIINANAANFDTRIESISTTFVKQISAGKYITTQTNNPQPGTTTINSSLVFTSGILTVLNYTNIAGQWNDTANYNDVFPPVGKTMNNLIAFIPSINQIWFLGTVDSNDAIRCTYENLPDRVRVWVQNTEQRSRAVFNYLAVWS